MKPPWAIEVIRALAILVFVFLGGLECGRRYSTNPNIWTVEKLVSTPNVVICPAGHTCTIKYFDLDTGKEIDRGKR